MFPRSGFVTSHVIRDRMLDVARRFRAPTHKTNTVDSRLAVSSYLKHRAGPAEPGRNPKRSFLDGVLNMVQSSAPGRGKLFDRRQFHEAISEIQP